MSLRFKHETVKEVSFEMRHGIKIIHGEKRNYYIINQKAKDCVGKREGSMYIKDHIKRELEGERLRAGMWLGARRAQEDLPAFSFKFYLYFRLVMFFSMLGETAFSLNPESFPTFKTLRTSLLFKN